MSKTTSFFPNDKYLRVLSYERTVHNNKLYEHTQMKMGGGQWIRRMVLFFGDRTIYFIFNRCFFTQIA